MTRKSLRERIADLGGKTSVVGNGIPVRERISIRLENVPADKIAELCDAVSETHTWEHERARVAELFAPLAPMFLECPAGTDRADRCCGARDITDPKCVCGGPNWREREDLEWYVGEAGKLLAQINSMVRASNAGLAASYALELGELIAEAKFKDRWEKAAITGQRSIERLPHDRHPSSIAERAAEFERQVQLNLAKHGKQVRMRAYADAAAALSDKYGITIGQSAIRAAVREARK